MIYGAVPHDSKCELHLYDIRTCTCTVIICVWAFCTGTIDQKKIEFETHFSDLFNKAILAPGTNGMTPLHSLMTSFCKTIDVKAMQLCVARLPPNFTAWQLLRLFQSRYPSVYKTVIFKQEEEENDDDDGTLYVCICLVHVCYTHHLHSQCTCTPDHRLNPLCMVANLGRGYHTIPYHTIPYHTVLIIG